MTKQLTWGIISTGRIAGVFAKGLAESETGELLAVASRTQEKADAFGKEFGATRCYDSYEALLADKDVEAVYIATPHTSHAKWAVKAANAGKHILCEKPITINSPDAMAVVEAALRNDVFLMEAFMYRCHPQTAKLAELIREGAIGEVRVIQASFGFAASFNSESRLFNPETGGGGILDVGCYPVSMSRLIAGAALGKPFAEPISVKAVGHLGESGVDEWTAAVLKFDGEIIAEVSTSVACNLENVVRVLGSKGRITVPSPWFCKPGKIIVQVYGETEPREIDIDAKTSLYAIEADTVARNIENRQAPSPAMSWDDTLGNMRTLDWWRQEIGLTYPQETLEANIPTIDHKPLSVRPGSEMMYGRVKGVNKPISRLVMGVTLWNWRITSPYASVMFDDFFAHGGNAFDTAYLYSAGNSDKTLGQWMKNRGIREQVVTITKGAHTPFCDPDNLSSQLLQTLDRMQTDYTDIHVMHRDNPDIPVGEFIDVLNEHKNAGRIHAFGGSNWSIERIEAANEYASSKGLTGMTAVSNNFSLARMVKPVWDGCIAASDPESRAWYTDTHMPLLSWSSLGRGFFVVGDPDYTTDKSLVDSWYSDDNFQRLARAKQLAKKRGVEPVAIAMAYVLNQPFPVFALFGPETLEQMRISLSALDVQLSPEELRWLNLED